MKRLNNKPVDMRGHICPQCNKLRMVRPLDHVVSLTKHTYKTTSGVEVELYIDICDHCVRRNYNKYFQPIKSDLRKIIRDVQHNTELPKDQSLENLL
mgnify:CR=1 FL=1